MEEVLEAVVENFPAPTGEAMIYACIGLILNGISGCCGLYAAFQWDVKSW